MPGNITPDYHWNLLPWRKEQKRQLYYDGLKLCLCAFLIAAFCVLCVLFIFNSLINQQNAANKKLNSEIINYTPQIKQADKLAQQLKQVKIDADNFQQISDQHNLLICILKNLPERMPSELYLDEFLLKNHEIRLKGQAETPDSIKRFTAQMQSLACIQKVIVEKSSPGYFILKLLLRPAYAA